MASPRDPRPPRYRRRRPEQGLLHRLLREHLATFLARADACDGRGLPRFVRRELLRYLSCGVLAFGFARVRCSRCGRDDLVAFSCKGRGFCPSCGARRMADTAAHLVDDVLPRVAVRQWVLSFPHRVRYLLAYDPRLCAAVRRIFVRVVLHWLEQRARREGTPGARSGAVVFTQRFGGALNSNLHFHAHVLDGVFTCPSPFTRAFFHAAEPLRDEHVEELTCRLQRRITRYLVRTGHLPRDPHGDEGPPDEPDEPLLAQLGAASVQGRVALGENSGRPVTRLGRRRGHQPVFVPGELCCDVDGFSLHAKILVEAHERERLEHLCRYVARPPLATERLSLAPDGRVVYRLRRRWRDGTEAIAFDPLTFIERLAARIPFTTAHWAVVMRGPASAHRGLPSTTTLPSTHLSRRPRPRSAVPFGACLSRGRASRSLGGSSLEASAGGFESAAAFGAADRGLPDATSSCLARRSPRRARHPTPPSSDCPGPSS